MTRIIVSRAFARLVEATNSGAIRWPARPLTEQERTKLAAEVAKAEAEPNPAGAYSQHLASGDDFLSRLKRETTNDDEAA